MDKEKSVELLNIVQSVMLTLIIPFTVYYVQHHSPYMEDKRYIEARLETQEKAVDRLVLILDRLASNQ